jgi:signal transduction histidine kinase
MKGVSVVAACLPALLWLAPMGVVAGEDDHAAATALRPISEILVGSSSEQDSGMLVKIRGVVTLALPERFDFAVEDDSASVWGTALEMAEVEPWGSVRRALRPGQEVEVTGIVDRGGYAPRILVRALQVVGGGDSLPPPQPADMPRLFRGMDNCRRVVLTGVVQGIREQGREWGLVVSSAARRLLVRISKATHPAKPEDLLDTTVRCVGVVGAVRNTRGEFLAPTLWIGTADDVTVIEPSPAEAFAAPLAPLERIAGYRFEPRSDHRLHIEGVVTGVVAGRSFYLQQGLSGVRVQSVSDVALQPGDRVQVAGFLDMSRQIAGISDALVRLVGHGEVPLAESVSPQDIIRLNTESRRLGVIAQPSNYDGCLVRFPARLVDKKTSVPGIGQLILSSGDATLSAVYEGEGFESLNTLKPGSELLVTGVIQIAMLGDEGLSSLASDPVVQQVSLWLRSPADVQVLKTPSWWTAGRLTAALSGLAAVLAGVLLWVGLLRRQVAATTDRLAAEMRVRRDAALDFEATLRERNRLAATLHDTLLQTLTGIDFQLGACRAGGLHGAEDLTTHLDVAQRMVAHASEELRGSVWALRTIPLAGRSFGESLELIARQTGQGHAAKITVRVAGLPSDIPQFVAGNLLLVTQEAMHNAVHHADAGQIEVVATSDAATGSIDLTVRDDGRGFTPGSQRGPDQGHFGLSGMRERIERLGGTWSITSQPESGTTVRAVVPTTDYDGQIDVGDGRAAGCEQLRTP